TGNYRYRLSERGHTRVAEALERQRYAGPAPVTADQYGEVIRRVQAQKQDPGRGRIKNVLHDLVLASETADSVARALFSGKAGIFSAPGGEGKKKILERLPPRLCGFPPGPVPIHPRGGVPPPPHRAFPGAGRRLRRVVKRRYALRRAGGKGEAPRRDPGGR